MTAARRSGLIADARSCGRLPNSTRRAIEGRSSRVGGCWREATWRNCSATMGSCSAAVSTRSTYALMTRTGSGRVPRTGGRFRSEPIVSRHARSIGLLAAREEPSGKVVVAPGKRVPQRGGLQRGGRHPEGVRRVRAADGVADDQQPGRERTQPLVAPAQVRPEPVADDAAEWFGVADRGAHVGRGGRLQCGRHSAAAS